MKEQPGRADPPSLGLGKLAKVTVAQEEINFLFCDPVLWRIEVGGRPIVPLPIVPLTVPASSSLSLMQQACCKEEDNIPDLVQWRVQWVRQSLIREKTWENITTVSRATEKSAGFKKIMAKS